MRRVYSHADGVSVGERTYTVFNVSGQRYPIVEIFYKTNDSRAARFDACGIRQRGLEKMSPAEIIDSTEYGRLAEALPHVIHTEAENERCTAVLETLLRKDDLRQKRIAYVSCSQC